MHGHQFKLSNHYILTYRRDDMRAAGYSSSDSCTWDRRQLTRSAIDLPLGLAPDLDGTRAGTTAWTPGEGVVKVFKMQCLWHEQVLDTFVCVWRGKHPGVLCSVS